MTKAYDARPPALNVLFRPGVTLRLNFHWVQGGPLTGRVFTSTLGGHDLTATVDGNTVVVTVPDEVTELFASGSRAEWTLAETVAGDSEPVLVGMWQASTAGAAGTAQRVNVAQGSMEVYLTVQAGNGPGGSTGGGAVDSVNGQSGIVSLDASDVGAASATSFASHTAATGAAAHLPTGGAAGQVATRDAGSTVVWGDVDADPAGTAATTVASHAAQQGAALHLPSGGTPGQVPTRGSDETVGWVDPPVVSVNGEAGAVNLAAAEVPFTPAGDLGSTNVQDALVEAAASGGAVDSVNGQTGPVTLAAADVPFTPAGGVTGATVQEAVVSAAAAGVATLMWDDTASEWVLRVGDPVTAPLREWWGPTAPVLTTGPYVTLWQEDDIFWDTSTP